MNTIRRLALSLFVTLGMALSACAGDANTVVTPADAAKVIKSDSSIVVLDVRTPAEFSSQTGHLAKALLIPVQELESRVGELASYKNRTILVYCRTGHRSTAGTEILLKHGFKALNMAGGITRWLSEGRPVVMEVK